MPKRSASSALGDQLTGGTKDVNPQFLHFNFALSAANTATEAQLVTPIVRVGPETGGTVIIMEILKVLVDFPSIDADAAAATGRRADIYFSTVSNSSGGTVTMPNAGNPRVFAWAQHDVRNAFTAAGTGALDIQENPRELDLTDGAGHGILIATDNIFIDATTTNQTGASGFSGKLMYRFKRVSLVEYIGIVQSQQ